MLQVKVNRIAHLSGHKDCIYAIEEGNDGLFYSAGGEGYVVEWNLKKPSEDGFLLASLPHSVYAMYFDKTKNLLWICENNYGIRIINVIERKEIDFVPIPLDMFFEIINVGDKMLVASKSGFIYVIDKEKYTLTDSFQISHKPIRAMKNVGNKIYAGCSDSNIYVLDAQTIKLIKSIENSHKDSVFALSHINSKYVLSGGKDAVLNVWNASTFEHLQPILAHNQAIHHIAVNNEKLLFATSSMDKTIKIWDAQTFNLLKVIDSVKFDAHKSSVNKIFWSSYNNQLISCSDDKSLIIWEIEKISA